MQIIASAERHIHAPARRVYHYIRDFREHHPRFLPPQFSDLQIETGGVGAGTVHTFTMTLGGRTTNYRVRVGEPEPGRVLIESDPSRHMLTTFTVDSDGGGSRVRIETRWHTNGVQGFVERLVAPRMLRRVYQAELALLDRYARDAVAIATGRAGRNRRHLLGLIAAATCRADRSVKHRRRHHLERSGRFIGSVRAVSPAAEFRLDAERYIGHTGPGLRLWRTGSDVSLVRERARARYPGMCHNGAPRCDN